MNTFYAIKSKYGEAKRIAVVNDKLMEMTEGEAICDIDKDCDYIYLGEDGDFLRPLTIMHLFGYISHNIMWSFEHDVDQLVSRFKQWGLRCDPDYDVCEMKVVMIETDNDDWDMDISSIDDTNTFLIAEGCGEEYCKQLARKVIEAAIALGVDLRTTWEVRRLENVTETKNQKQDE